MFLLAHRIGHTEARQALEINSNKGLQFWLPEILCCLHVWAFSQSNNKTADAVVSSLVTTQYNILKKRRCLFLRHSPKKEYNLPAVPPNLPFYMCFFRLELIHELFLVIRNWWMPQTDRLIPGFLHLSRGTRIWEWMQKHPQYPSYILSHLIPLITDTEKSICLRKQEAIF